MAQSIEQQQRRRRRRREPAEPVRPQPLRAILLISQAQRNPLRPVGLVETSEIQFPPVGLKRACARPKRKGQRAYLRAPGRDANLEAPLFGSRPSPKS